MGGCQVCADVLAGRVASGGGLDEVVAGAQDEHSAGLWRDTELRGEAAPDVTLVRELVARACGSGLKVSLRLEGEREGLAPAVSRAAYSVVQEGLTNALRHASGAKIEVLLRGAPDGLLVEVLNDRAVACSALLGEIGTGSGLVGLRDRVAAAGGRLDAGPTANGGWCVSARMPRQPASRATGLA